jgi:hypothetical protein
LFSRFPWSTVDSSSNWHCKKTIPEEVTAKMPCSTLRKEIDLSTRSVFPDAMPPGTFGSRSSMIIIIIVFRFVRRKQNYRCISIIHCHLGLAKQTDTITYAHAKMRLSFLSFFAVITSHVTGTVIVGSATETTTSSYSILRNNNNNNNYNVYRCWGCVSRGGGAAVTGSSHDDDNDDAGATSDTTPSYKPTKIPSGGTSTTANTESKYATQLELVKEQVLASTMPEVSKTKNWEDVERKKGKDASIEWLELDIYDYLLHESVSRNMHHN